MTPCLALSCKLQNLTAGGLQQRGWIPYVG